MCARKRTVQLIREVTSLPALPTLVQRLLAVLRDPNYTADQVTEVVRSDPALAARVLKLANSPAYGFSRNIETVSRAVVVLGSRSLRSLVTAAGVAQALEKLAGSADFEELWCHAAYTATGAQVLARRAGHPCPEEVFLAGLIHDIGELALAVVRPREYGQIMKRPAVERIEAQRQVLGLTHTRAGSQLLTAWNLPDDLCAVAGNHHSLEATTAPDNRTLSLVALADMLSRVRDLGHEAPPPEAHLIALLKAAGLSRGITAELVREIDLRYLETSRFLHPDSARIQAPFSRPEPRRVALVCTDPVRSLLLHELFAYHGDEVLPFAEYFETPDRADLVVLDPHCLDAKAIDHLAPALARTPDRLAVYGAADLCAGLPADLPTLPVLFNQSDLAGLPSADTHALSSR